MATRVLYWGAKYAHENCPNKAGDWGNIKVYLFTDPSDKIDSPSDRAPVEARNYPDDRVDWFAPRSEYSNDYQYKLSQAVKDESRQKERARKQEEANRRAAQVKKNIDRNLLFVNQEVDAFLSTGSTNIEVLGTAILSRQLDTLALMEDDDITIRGLVSNSVQTRGYGDSQYYAASYQIKSLHEQILDKFQSKQSFSWGNFADQTQNVGRGYVNITCLFSSVQDIPRVAANVSASLKSFDGRSELILFCE